MFFQYNSNSLTELSHIFSQKTIESKKGSPFLQSWIVVQNKEAREWISLRTAGQAGISFNNEFILPSELTWKLYRLYNPELPKELPSDKSAMQWQIFELLSDSGIRSKLPYNLSSTKNRLQFAAQVADVFDLYQVYRPEMLELWEESKRVTQEQSEQWQMTLWNELATFWETNYPDLPHRGDAFRELILNFKSKNSFKYLPKQLFIIGLSNPSAPFLKLISELSNLIDVHYFATSFGKEKIQFLNEWKKPKDDSEKLLRNFLNDDHIQITNSFFEELGTDVPQLELHSCHSPRREVEVMKNKLLEALNSDSNLKPEEILIMVPDPEEYFGLIEGLFKGSNGDPVIPVYNPEVYKNTILESFTAVLELLSGKIEVTGILDLLEYEPIGKYFQISEDELPTLREWMVENRIHWGLTFEESGFSLEKGVGNLISGFAMEVDPFESFGEFIPYSKVTVSDHFELAARFSSFVNTLKEFRNVLFETRSSHSWVSLLLEFFDKFFPFDKNHEIGVITTRNDLEKLQKWSDFSASEERINFTEFLDWFKNQLSEQQASSTGLSHGLVMSSYVPYRGIPFKKVFVLGMNENAFPRNPVRPSFDLINQNQRAGERVMKQDDTLLFYELLKSTEESIFISYIGQDQHSNNEKLPSILIQQLQDEFDHLIPVKHKLHDFHHTSSLGEINFSGRTALLAELNQTEQNFTPVFRDVSIGIERFTQEPVIQLSDLISFYSHPYKYLLTKGLSLKKASEKSNPVDREVFSIKGLTKYDLDQMLFDSIELDVEDNSLIDFVRKSGLLPENAPGEKAFDETNAEIKELTEFAGKYAKEEAERQVIDLKSENYSVFGSVEHIYGDTIVFIKVARIKPKDILSSWINLLAAHEMNNQIIKVVLIGRDKDHSNTIYQLSIPEGYSECLKNLIRIFSESATGEKELVYFPETSYAYQDAFIKNKNADSAARSTWEGNDYIKGESEDFYNQTFWRGKNPLNENAFKEYAGLIWGSVLAQLRELKSE